MIRLYGIPNCDTVKKARNWLNGEQISFEFTDFKKTPPSEALIREWLTQIPLEVLLNKRGTTWRKLDAQTQASASEPQAAVLLMAAQPSLIKRPVLEREGRYHAGFTEEDYRDIFAQQRSDGL